VQTVSLRDLKGMDDVIRALEANVIMPLEHSELAEELSLRPKRGVLLAGPPGTGKTTGRPRARPSASRQVLLDRRHGDRRHADVLQSAAQRLRAAMRNAPAVVFIDDSDVIFEGQDPGLYRYLLTMLDGLEARVREASALC
jgi:SpoVK/Ycf46/Vps4 family AAA+-type ATPase